MKKTTKKKQLVIVLGKLMNISPPKGTEKMTEDNSNELFRLLEIDIVFYSHNQLINFLEALEK